jgi:hypothetical protein
MEASPHLPVVRAAWLAVKGGRRQAAAAQSRQATEEAAHHTFPCPVCLTDSPLTTRVVLPGCRDALCQPCLLASLGYQLAAQPRSTRFRCPFGPACAHFAASREAPQPYLGFTAQALAALVEEGGSQALQRQWALARNPALIPCPAPHCARGYAPRPTRFSAWLAQCTFCSTQFCAQHGLEHAIDPQDPAAACQAHAAALQVQVQGQEQLQLRSQDPALLPGTQPCPGCLAPSFRERGCDHMLCPLCDTRWCWACGGVRLSSGHECAAWVAQPEQPERACGGERPRRACQLLQRAARLAWRGLQGVALAPLALPFALLHVALLLVLSALLAPSVLAQMAYQLLRSVRACVRDYHDDCGSPCLFICSLMRSTGCTAVGQSRIFVEGLAGLVAVVVSLGFPAPQAFFKRRFTAWLVHPPDPPQAVPVALLEAVLLDLRLAQMGGPQRHQWQQWQPRRFDLV